MRRHSEVAHPIRRVAMSKTWWIAADQLDKEQKDVIDLDLTSDHVIFGPPGSGKTNLLLLRAKYLHLGDQKNIEIIVFTRTLHRFMLAGGHQYEFPSDKLKTLKKWQRGGLLDGAWRDASHIESFRGRARTIVGCDHRADQHAASVRKR